MRLAAILLSSFVALSVTAQTADTTSAWRYLALEVGNVWEYERWQDECAPEPPFCDPVPDGFTRFVVRGDTIVSDTAYWILRESRFYGSSTPFWTRDLLVRYDPSEARAYGYRLDGAFWEYWPGGLYCPLDMPFEGDWGKCEEGGGHAESYEETVLGEVVLVKRFSTQIGVYDLVADLGLVSSSGGDFVTAGRDLTYARVGGRELGVEQFPVSSEAGAPSVASRLSIFPNPSRYAVTAHLSLDRPQRATFSVYNVLGRQVLSADLGALPAGEAIHRLDLAALRPGVYVVRLQGDRGARATTRLVVQ